MSSELPLLAAGPKLGPPESAHETLALWNHPTGVSQRIVNRRPPLGGGALWLMRAARSGPMKMSRCR